MQEMRLARLVSLLGGFFGMDQNNSEMRKLYQVLQSDSFLNRPYSQVAPGYQWTDCIKLYTLVTKDSLITAEAVKLLSSEVQRCFYVILQYTPNILQSLVGVICRVLGNAILCLL